MLTRRTYPRTARPTARRPRTAAEIAVDAVVRTQPDDGQPVARRSTMGDPSHDADCDGRICPDVCPNAEDAA